MAQKRYNASEHSVSNKSFAVQGIPESARNMFYDNFIYRPFISPEEVNLYFNTPESRKWASNIWVNTGGTLLDDVVTGGTNELYYYKDGVADVNLVRMASASTVPESVLLDIDSLRNNKVDKVAGKGLSEVDFSAVKDTKLGGIQAGATVNQSDSTLKNADNHSDGLVNKVYTAIEKAKLAAIAADATKNATDAQLRDSTTHTGQRTAAAAISDFNAAADVRVDNKILLLKDGVGTQGDTLQKLYNLFLTGVEHVSKATITDRNAHVAKVLDQVFVLDDGDGKWALYQATTAGVNAVYIKLSDPDLLNAVLSNAQIKVSYESNADTNALTNALLAKINALTGTNTGDETATTLGTKIAGAADKTAPVDADIFSIIDSAAANILKKFTWANIKAALKSYFDGIYQTKEYTLAQYIALTAAQKKVQGTIVDTAAALTAGGATVIAAGWFVYESDTTNLPRVADGVTALSSLAYDGGVSDLAAKFFTTDFAQEAGKLRPIDRYANGDFGYWSIVSNFATVSGIGIAPTSIIGTAEAVPYDHTTSFGRLKKVAVFSAATAGGTAGYRPNANGLEFSRNAGFIEILRFACLDAATVAGARCFHGMRDSSSSISTSTDTSAAVNIIGVGSDTGDVNLSIIHNDGTAGAVKIPLGASFPAHTLSADAYELILVALPSDLTKIKWTVTNILTGVTATGDMTTKLPAVDALMGPLSQRGNNATALAVKSGLLRLKMVRGGL